jgi:hypothetical protein
MNAAQSNDADVFVGFDLGHGDSCLMLVNADGDEQAIPLEVGGKVSFPTVLVTSHNGTSIGWHALGVPDPEEFDIGFKGRPTKSEDWPERGLKITRFAKACYEEVSKFLPDATARQHFVVGCPSGWDRADQEKYLACFVAALLPDPRVERESRATFIHARDSGLIPAEKLRSSIVVIDVGSSTTDITYLKDRKVVDVKAGDMLGAGLIDQAILERNLELSCNRNDWLSYFAAERSEKNVALVASRRLKEKFFESSPEMRARGVKDIAVLLKEDLILGCNDDLMNYAVDQPCSVLGGRSWKEAFRGLLAEVRKDWGQSPEYLLLGGGASRMEFVSEICKELFSGTVIRHDANPQTAVASGLAAMARWERRCDRFIKEVEALFTEDVLYNRIAPEAPKALSSFIGKSYGVLFGKIIPSCIDAWREGEVRAKEGLTNAVMNKTKEWEQSEEAVAMKSATVKVMVESILGDILVERDRICAEYRIDKRVLNFQIDLGQVPYVDELRRMLGFKVYEMTDRGIGRLADEIFEEGRNVPEWLAGVTKWYLRTYGAIAGPVSEWIMRAVDFNPSEYQAIVRNMAKELNEQLMVQFREQIDDVLSYIR